MSTETLHDQNGDWIAVRVDSRYIYSPNGTLVGFCLSDQPDVVIDESGGYMAEVVGDRLFRRSSPPYVPNPGYQPNPGYASMPSHPGNKGYASLPSGMEEVPKDLLPGA